MDNNRIKRFVIRKKFRKAEWTWKGNRLPDRWVWELTTVWDRDGREYPSYSKHSTWAGAADYASRKWKAAKVGTVRLVKIIR